MLTPVLCEVKLGPVSSGLISSRVARRRGETRLRIISVAARRFASSGLDGARLDEIADEADVARGTLYSHFATKESLIAAIVRPALESAVESVGQLRECVPREAVDGLLRTYLLLWDQHREALRVAQKAQEMPLGDLSHLHGAFMRVVTEVFRRAEHEHILRCDNPALAGRLMARVAIPLLELYSEQDEMAKLFIDTMRGMLLREQDLEPNPA